MRYLEDGPDIPDALIAARDQGDVVFFCGAGVSYPTFPDFAGLTRKILEQLSPNSAIEAFERGEGPDNVFSILTKEFGGAEIDRAISDALQTPRRVDLSHHRAVLDLSRDPQGRARIVTTNFDRLFERADRSLRRFVPPVLPDLEVLEPLEGLVYLHGRLNTPTSQARAGYVISSADFGRAYLAEGWAARFVRALRERYTIVLLGYSANDPPMRYLLEGLSSREGAAYRSRIYAFAPASSLFDAEAWHDKGVVPITYAARDGAHSGLWDTLALWAESAREPDAWRRRVLALAQGAPRNLRPFERGQVMHLVGTTAGARAFALADPTPPAEWLAVLDATRRYSQPWSTGGDDGEIFDPLDVYGLDSDPPRLPAKSNGISVIPGTDAMRWREGDVSGNERVQLTGFIDEWSNQLPPRLHQITNWIARVMNQPAAVAWAAGSRAPHPALATQIRHRLDDDDIAPPARHFWRCYLEAGRAQRGDWHDLRGYAVSERAEKEGWTPSVLRELERVLTPRFEVGRWGRDSIPTKLDWEGLALFSFVQIEVKVSPLGDKFLVAPGALPAVLQMMRRSLLRFSEMLDESSTAYWTTPTLHPSGERGESPDFSRTSGHFLQFAQLYSNLVQSNADAARDEAAAWPVDDGYFFAKLFLYAASFPDLLAPTIFAQRLLAMPDEIFWDSDQQRELLFGLRRQWPALSLRDRKRIERRITSLAPPYDDDGAEDRQRRSTRAATILRWMQLEGLLLTPVGQRHLDKLRRAALPDWSDDWAKKAARSNGPWGGYVEQVTDPSGLTGVSPKELLAAARELSTSDHHALRDFRPFDGLVEQSPFKALVSLRIEARRGSYPNAFWSSLLSHWPQTARERATLLLAHTLTQLPGAVFDECRFGIANFVERSLVKLPRHSRRAVLRAFDAIVARYAASAPSVLASSIHEMPGPGREPKRKSDASRMKSINSPGGTLCEALFTLMGPLRRRGAMPREFAPRFEQLLNLPGDGGAHAACIIAFRLSWLEYWAPRWAARLLPRFALTDTIAPGLWHGLAADRRLLLSESEGAIAEPYLALLLGAAPWPIDTDERHALIHRFVFLSGPGGDRLAKHQDVRKVLVACSDEDRAQALHEVGRALDQPGGWKSQVKPFMLSAWPRQLRCQSSVTSSALVAMIEKTDEDFPDAVATLRSFLRPVEHLDIFAYRMRRADGEGRNYATRFPAATLDLLDRLIDQNTSLWNIGQVLDRIAEARPSLRNDSRWRRLRGG